MTESTPPTPPTLTGVGASPGLAIGPVRLVERIEAVVPTVDDPKAALDEAVTVVSAQLEAAAERATSAGRGEAGDVLRAQSLMASDPMVVDSVHENLDSGLSFNDAITAADTELTEMLASIPDPYLSARSADVGEIMHAIRLHLSGVTPTESGSGTSGEPAVLVAHELTAAETADLDPADVLGFATEVGGATSHVAIIARSLGLPAVVAVKGLVDQAPSRIAIDGSTGEIIVDPEPAVAESWAERGRQADERTARLNQIQGQHVHYGDSRIVVPANVGGSADIERAIGVEADGVGLFRTEFLFLDRPDPPSEDEQYEVYRQAAEGFGQTVVIRTFDVGGDKPAEFITLEPEENPFLGMRGVRLYDVYPELFTTQIRACLRAAAHGPVAVMVPMVATVDEIVAVSNRVAELTAEMNATGESIGSIELGVMVEVPSVALNAAAFAPHVDFFSIGTNDLTQYTMAADRMLGELAELNDPLQPSVLRLCSMLASVGKATGTPVSVCGLAAADPLAAVIFAAVGITKLSVSANSVNLIKATIEAQDPARAADVVAIVDSAATVEEVRKRIAEIVVDP